MLVLLPLRSNIRQCNLTRQPLRPKQRFIGSHSKIEKMISRTDPVIPGEGDHAQAALKGDEMQPIAEAFCVSFGFGRVIGTEGAINYLSPSLGVFPSNDSYLMPYPQSGMWNVFLPELFVNN